MAFADVEAKTTITGYTDAQKTQIRDALQTMYDGSALAKAMFDTFLATPGKTITITNVAGKMQAFLNTGKVEFDLALLNNASYINPKGKAVADTLVSALLHELGHALGNKPDNWSNTDYKGDNVKLVNPMYVQLGIDEQLSYIAYDANSGLHKLNFEYTSGKAIDAARSGNTDWNASPLGNSADLLIGGAAANKLDGGQGDDWLWGAGGDDTLNGGDGKDTVGYFQNKLEYDVRLQPDGSWVVRHARGAKDEGSDKVLNVEQIRFGNGETFDLKKKGLTYQTDFAFVVDTTGSMGPFIGAVRDQMTAITNALFDGKTDPRIGVVTFKDETIGEPTNVVLKFTDHDNFDDRKAAAIAAINSIGVGGGGDIPETYYAGLMAALDGRMGDWRPGAGVLRIAGFTDAPAKDGHLLDAVTALANNIGASIGGRSTTMGYTTSITTFELTFNNAAAARDPSTEGDVFPPYEPADSTIAPDPRTATLEVYTIYTGPTGGSITGLAEIAAATGGKFLTATTPEEIVEALLEIITAPPNQTLIGTDEDDTIDGGEGNDVIFGLGGNDTLRGHGGNDFIDGGPGADMMDGGAGFDIASWLTQLSGATINLANPAANAGSAAGDQALNFEAFFLTNFNDVFTAADEFVFVYGFNGDDTITGSSVSDIISGGPGADTVNGGGGFNYLSYYDSYIYGEGDRPITLDLKNPANNTGDAAGDVISNFGAFILTRFNDTFVGADSGQNIAFGYEGNDTFIGGFNANNWFFGGPGNDRMVGGGVQDLFVLGANANTIALATPTPISGSSVFGFKAFFDGVSARDRIEISREAFGLSPTYAVTDGSTFVSGSAPTATTGQPTFYYYNNSGLFYFDPDGTGSTGASLLLQFASNGFFIPFVSPNDILLVP